MPTVGLFHATFRWNFSDTNAAPVRFSRGGYAGWQAGVVLPSLLGFLGAWIDTHWAMVKWHWRFATRVHGLSQESRAVMVKALDALEDPRYPHAQQAVRVTAKTLGFNRPEAWKGLNRHMKDSPGRAENTFRHLNACALLRTTSPSTVTSWDQHLMVELAYHGYTFTRK